MNDLRKAINANKREMKANKKRYDQLQAQGKAQREDLLESDWAGQISTICDWDQIPWAKGKWSLRFNTLKSKYMYLHVS